MKILVSVLLSGFLFCQLPVDNIYSESYSALNNNLEELEFVRDELTKKYSELLDQDKFQLAYITKNMKHEIRNNWGQLFGLLEVLSIANDILLYHAYHDCNDVDLRPKKPQFRTIATTPLKPNPKSKALLNLAIKKLDIMNKTVRGVIKIDMKYFNKIINSKDKDVKDNLAQLAIDINSILSDIESQISKMVLT